MGREAALEEMLVVDHPVLTETQYRVFEGHEKNFASLAGEFVRATLDVRGAIDAVVTCEAGGAHFVVLETYENAAALLRHLRDPVVQEANKLATALSRERSMVVFGYIDEAVRAALAEHDPLYLEPIAGGASVIDRARP